MPPTPVFNARVRIAFLWLFVLLAAGMYFANDLSKLQEKVSTRDDEAALQGVSDPGRLDEALKRHPSNKILQLMTLATKAAADTWIAVDRISSQIEPARLAKEIDFNTASRDDLDAYRRDLKTAQANAGAFLPRYAALFRAEHDRIENAVRSFHIQNEIAGNVLNGLARRHSKTLAVISSVLSARADYYDAYEKYIAMLEGESGSYRVVDGRFVFPLQRTVERYNAAALSMTTAARRVADREAEMKEQNQPLPEEWRSLTAIR